MNAAVIKALSRRIEDRYGSNRAVALAAGVQPSVWSAYVSDDHPNSTIPFGRLLTVANAEERAAFAELLLGETPIPPGDMVCEASEITEGAANLQRRVRVAASHGTITRREARGIVSEALAVKAEVEDVIRLAERAA